MEISIAFQIENGDDAEIKSNGDDDVTADNDDDEIVMT